MFKGLILNNPKELKIEFIGKGEVKGYLFKQVKSSQTAFIYQVNTGKTIHYEVFRKVLNERFNCISYPGSKSFGFWAWTFSLLTNANIKFFELNNFKKDLI